MKRVIWTDYMKYRMKVREYEPVTIEHIVRSSEERYYDTATHRMIAVGRHGGSVIIIPYEEDDETVTPITVHPTTRQQINLRLRVRRFLS